MFRNFIEPLPQVFECFRNMPLLGRVANQIQLIVAPPYASVRNLFRKEGSLSNRGQPSFPDGTTSRFLSEQIQIALGVLEHCNQTLPQKDGGWVGQVLRLNILKYSGQPLHFPCMRTDLAWMEHLLPFTKYAGSDHDHGSRFQEPRSQHLVLPDFLCAGSFG